MNNINYLKEDQLEESKQEAKDFFLFCREPNLNLWAAVGECKKCNSLVDEYGKSVEHRESASEACETCGSHPCTK